MRKALTYSRPAHVVPCHNACSEGEDAEGQRRSAERLDGLELAAEGYSWLVGTHVALPNQVEYYGRDELREGMNLVSRGR
jgi:hypothetical protein